MNPPTPMNHLSRRNRNRIIGMRRRIPFDFFQFGRFDSILFDMLCCDNISPALSDLLYSLLFSLLLQYGTIPGPNQEGVLQVVCLSLPIYRITSSYRGCSISRQSVEVRVRKKVTKKSIHLYLSFKINQSIKHHPCFMMDGCYVPYKYLMGRDVLR